MNQKWLKRLLKKLSNSDDQNNQSRHIHRALLVGLKQCWTSLILNHGMGEPKPKPRALCGQCAARQIQDLQIMTDTNNTKKKKEK